MRKHRLVSWVMAGCLAFAAVSYATPLPEACAETKVVEADGVYVVGDTPDESLSSAREHAKEQAMRRAAETAGIYIESYSKTANFVLTEDEVRTVASKVLDVQSVSYRSDDMGGKGFTLHCHIRATVDTVKVDDILNQRGSPHKSADDTEMQNKELAERLATLQGEREKIKDRIANPEKYEDVIAIESKLSRFFELDDEEMERIAEPDGLALQLLAKDPGNRIAIAALTLYCNMWHTDSEMKKADALFQELCESYPKEPLVWYGRYLCTKDKRMLYKADELVYEEYTEAEFYHRVTYTVVKDMNTVHSSLLTGDIYGFELTNCMRRVNGESYISYSYPGGEDFVLAVPRFNPVQSRDPFATYYAAETSRDAIWKTYGNS